MPADSEVSWFSDGDAYAWSGINSLAFDYWTQGDDGIVWVHCNNVENQLDSSSVTTTFAPNVPYFRLLNDRFVVAAGDSIQLAFTLVNDGLNGGPFIATVVSSDSELIPNFSLNWSDSVQNGDTVNLVNPQFITIPNQPDLWGRMIQLTLRAASNSFEAVVHILMRPSLVGFGYWFSQPVTVALDSVSQTLFVGSSDTLFCFNGDWSLRWQIVPWPGHPINSIAVGDVVGTTLGSREVACVIDSQRVYLSSAANGQHLWPIGFVNSHTISTPGVFMAPITGGPQDYVCFFDDNLLKMYDCGLTWPPLPYRNISRNQVVIEAPFTPTGVCWIPSPLFGDSAVGGGFVLTHGLHDRTNGSFVVMNALADILFPEDWIGFNLEYGYGVPVAGEFNPGDGSFEISWTFFNQAMNGGVMTCIYSVHDGQADFEILDVPGEIHPTLAVNHGYWSDWISRLCFTFYYPESGYTYLASGQMVSRLAAGNNPAYISTIGFDFSGYFRPYVVQGREVMIASDEGSGNTPLYYLPYNRAIGQGLIIRDVNWNTNWAIPVSSDSDHYANRWTMALISVPEGTESDWQGQFGNGQNTGCHPFLSSRPIPCLGPDDFHLTIENIAVNTCLVRATLCGYTERFVTHWKLFSTDSLNGNFAVYDSTVSNLRDFWKRVPTNSNKQFFYAQYEYELVLDGSNFWGRRTLWWQW